MADSSDELTLPKADAGLAFRAEMWATNAILGYWWVIAGVIAVILASVAIYGFIDSMVTSAQRTASAETESVMQSVQSQLLDPDAILRYEQRPGADGQMVRWGQIVITPSFTALEAPNRSMVPFGQALGQFARKDVEPGPVLTEAGDKLMAIYTANSGVSAHQAALYAGQMYRLAKDVESEKKALEAASTASVDAIRYPAQARLAWIALDGGDPAAAEALLRPWINKDNGWFGQQAAYDLGRAYEAQDRKGDAEAVYRDLLNTWPATPLRDLVDVRLEQMGVDAVPMDDGAEPGGDAADDDAAGQGTTPDGAPE